MSKTRTKLISQKKRILYLGFLVFVLFLGLGYSLLSSNLLVNGNIIVYKLSEPVLKAFTDSDKSAFHSTTYSSKIVSITLQNNIYIPTDAIESWDVSVDQRGKVMAYVVTNSEDDTKYDLYIQGNGHLYANPNSSYLFNKLTAVTIINNLDVLDTSNVTNMSYMFADCQNLLELDLSNFNTSNVTNMNHMFFHDYKIKSLNLMSFDTNKVTDMSYMFAGKWQGYTSIYPDGYNEGFVTGDLESITFNFNTPNVTDMSYMFAYQSKLLNIDVSSFNTSNVTNMSHMFHCCSSLTSLNVSNFNTSNVTDMSYMFAGRRFGYGGPQHEEISYYGHLISLDLSNFNTSNVTNMASMIAYQPELVSVNLSSFNTSNVTTMKSMFEGDQSLTVLDLSSFDTSNVTNMQMMFGVPSVQTDGYYVSVFDDYNGEERDLSISTIYVSNMWSTDSVTDQNSRGMFSLCINLPNYSSSYIDKTKANYDTGGYLQLKP